MDSDIDDRVPGRNNQIPPSKPSTPAIRLLSGLFSDGTSRATSSKGDDSSPFPKANLLPKLPPSIVP